MIRKNKYISVTNEYCIVIRCNSIKNIGLSEDDISKILEFDNPLDSNCDIVSYGPSFGMEASDEFIKRLEHIGLLYIDDFFIFYGDFPQWCDFKVGVREGFNQSHDLK